MMCPHLLYLAPPPLLALMWPSIHERCPSSFNHLVTERIVFIAVWIAIARTNALINSPTTLWRVGEMLMRRVITGFPAIKLSLTKKAANIIGTCRCRSVIEPRMGKLAVISNITARVNETFKFTPLLGLGFCGAMMLSMEPSSSLKRRVALPDDEIARR